MAAADNLDMSAARDITLSYSAKSLPFDVPWTDGFATKTAVIKQEDSGHYSSVVHCGINTDTEYTDMSNSSCLLSNRLGLDSVDSTLCSDALTVMESNCWNSTSAAIDTDCNSSSSVSCCDSTSLLSDNISHPVSSINTVEKEFLPSMNGLHWVYNEAMLKKAVTDCSVLAGVSTDVITAVANCTRPLFDCVDDDDSNIDRLVIDIKDEDSEPVSDDLESVASSVDNASVCDNFDKCSLLSEHSATCKNIKQEILSEAENCDAISEAHAQCVEEKPLIETIKVEAELSPTAIEAAKPADILTADMFMRWPGVSGRVGAGLQNLGNTCFVNATVQCLTYTVPLVNYLLTLNHSAACTMSGMCLMCEMEQHVRRCFENSGAIVKPQSILQMLKVIARHMRWGRQEDAHEFLRYMVEAMHKSCVNGHQMLPQTGSREKSVVNEIFGGYLRSQVTCLQCHAKSNTFDPFLDISLDVKNVSSIARALERFSEPEILDTENAYICIKCKSKVRAQKRFTLHKLPNVLTVQLKRYGMMGGKVTRHIVFPEVLDVQPYVSHGCRASSKTSVDEHRYRLYGVLVHEGHSTSSGHYYCYVMTADGSWYCMNDHIVRKSSLSQVLNAEAYMLFYKKGVTLAKLAQDDGCSVRPLSANGKTRSANGVDGVNRHQRSSSPGCLSSRLISDHTAGVASPRLVPTAGMSHQPTAVRKSACLGGQSLATSAAKRLLARPACRGGRMMPEQAAKHRTVKKRRKRTASKLVTDENDKSCREQKFQSVLASESKSVGVKEKTGASENDPAPSLPRIVIKIHQGRIVSPSAIASPSKSSVGMKQHATEYRGSSTMGNQESKSTDVATQRAQKSDRMKTHSISRQAKPIAGSKPNPKIASQSTTTSSKVLADRNSNVAYFDSSQLQESSFDKLSLDCCMKLYSQLGQQQRTASQPLQSFSEDTKLSKPCSTLKSRHKSSDSKKRPLHRVKLTACVSERLPKVQAVGNTGNLVKVSAASHPPDCTVQLNRISSVSDFSVTVPQSSGGNLSQVKSTVRERLSSSREQPSVDSVYDFVVNGSDNIESDSCSVTLTPRSQHGARSCAAIQQNDIPTATETVPGSYIGLSNPRRFFSKRSHTPTDSDCSTSVSPKKSRSAKIDNHSNSSDKSRTSILSSLLTSSVHDKYRRTAVVKSDPVLSGDDVTYVECATDCISTNIHRDFEVSSATESRKNAILESATSPVSDMECSRSSSETSTGRKRCNLTASLSSSDSISRSKKKKISRLLGEVPAQLSPEPPASNIIDEVSDTNPACRSLSPLTSCSSDTAACQSATVPEVSSDSEPQYSDMDWLSPSCSPDSSQTAESSNSPLRLKIRRLADISPVRELYNVVGQAVKSDTSPSSPCNDEDVDQFHLKSDKSG